MRSTRANWFGYGLAAAGVGLLWYLSRRSADIAAVAAATPAPAPTIILDDVGMKITQEDRGPEIVQALLADKTLSRSTIYYEDANRYFSKQPAPTAPEDLAINVPWSKPHIP